MTVTQADISADTGEIYDAVDGGTTAVASMIVRAQNYVSGVGGAVSDDDVIRPLADSMVVNQVIGGIDSVNKTIGTISVGNKDMNLMRRYFKDEAKVMAIKRGYSLDGSSILFETTTT